MTHELKSLLTLSHIPSFGPVKIKKLFHKLGSASAVLDTLGVKKIEEVDRDLSLIDKYGATLIPFYDPLYPPSLLKLPDPPPILYVLGELREDDFEGLAIVGTRTATLYGKQTAYEFGQSVAQTGKTVVSGLARGIDTEAHLGALEGGRSIAVIGSGLANLYPKENIKLAEALAKNGAVISEFPMNTAPSKHTFPRRNRIVSGLTKGTLLVESGLTGGAMITMELARVQKKKCFALPGRIDTPTFAGNLELIKTGRAQLVSQVTDIVKIPPSVRQIALTEEEKGFLAQFPKEEKSVDELVLLTQLPVMKLNVLLTRLVLKKVIKEFPGKLFKRLI